MNNRVIARMLIVFLVGLASTGSGLFSGEDPLPLEPERVRIVGLLSEELRFGPPGYGETPKEDVRTMIPMLVLSSPVSVSAEGGGDRDVVEIEKIQLLLPKGIEGDKYVGETVEVGGVLFYAESGQHYTPVVMSVESMH